MRNRIHELDYLKCLFIILMIIFHLSHIGSKYPYAKSIVYTFHMPAFLLISGYLINVHKKPEIFLKAMAWIFIPYTIMEISYACMSMLFPVWDGIKEISASVLLGKVLLDPIGPYWYLHTFILCGTTYYFVHTYLSSTPFIRLLVTSSLLLLFSYIFHLLTFANAFYFMAGTAIHLGKRPFLSCFPASFLAIIPLVFLCSQPENLNRGTLGGILITGLVISLSLYIYKHLPHTVKQASLFIGKNTLPILLFSPVFTALSKLFLPFFRSTRQGYAFSVPPQSSLCTVAFSSHSVWIKHAFLLSSSEKDTHIENRHLNRTYITATHDRNNPRSGNVMRKLGMTYCYSYEEQWQPKNFPVIFRMYQLNLDGNTDSVYRKYWDTSENHFIEDL